jgi:hypothetical protein
LSNFFIKNPECVFIHIPKTGGTSIRKGPFEASDRHFEMPDKFAKFYKFAFVRNPFDRIVSAWYMFNEGERYSFAEFVKIAIDDSIDHRVGISGITMENKIRHHTIAQLHPANCLEHANFLGRYENLQEDFDKLCDILETPRVDLPRIRPLPYGHRMPIDERPHFSSHYDKKTIELVGQYFKDDLKKLGYQFETK